MQNRHEAGKQWQGFILLLAYVIVTLLVFALEGVAADYVYRRLALLNYGNGAGQIGLLDLTGIPRTGPESFWVNEKGDVYICDTVNSRVVHLSGKGDVISSVDLAYPCNDIAVDDIGNMFVLEWSTGVLHYMSLSGFEKEDCEIPRELLSDLSNLGMTDNHPTLVTGNQEEYVLPKFDAPLAPTVNSRLTPKGVHLSQNDNARVVVQITEMGRAKISVIKDSDFSVRTYSTNMKDFVLPEWDVKSVSFIGEDKLGNLYIQVEIWNSCTSRIVLKVYSVDSSGEPELVIDEVPNDYWVWTAKLLQVNEQGDIYQLLPTERGVYINLWKRVEKGSK